MRWKAKRYTGKREQSCSFYVGFDEKRHMVLRCRKPATWRLTETNCRRGPLFATVALACEECKVALCSPVSP